MKEETLIGRGLRDDAKQVVAPCAGEQVSRQTIANQACDGAVREMTPEEIGAAAERQARIRVLMECRNKVDGVARRLQEVEMGLPFGSEMRRYAIKAATEARMWLDESIRESRVS